MVISGHDGCEDHAERMLQLAVDMLHATETVLMPAQVESEFAHVRIRIGLHSGPAAAGVIGSRTPCYSARAQPLSSHSQRSRRRGIWSLVLVARLQLTPDAFSAPQTFFATYAAL